jgi:23S rRNA (uracil1939-C5)-methyltransferase
MSRNKKPLPVLKNITITDCAAEGKSLARITIPAHDGQTEDTQMVVFVPWCVPGDVVDLQVRRKKHSFMEAEVIRFNKYSNVRAIPFCEHFGTCGGCKWQNLPYDAQLSMKQKQVYDQLTRIGHLHLPTPGTTNEEGIEFRTILGSVKTKEYRNKLDFGASNRRYLTKEEIESGREFQRDAIGFHITGAFDKILPINCCHLMDDLQNQIRNEIFEFAVSNGISFFDLRAQTGLLRDVMVRNSNTSEWMVLVQFHFEEEKSKEQALALLDYIANKFPQISSLLWVDNQKCNDTIGDLEVNVYRGNDHIFETMEDLRFKVGPKSFYQTNTEQAYHLYSVVRNFAFEEDSSNSIELAPDMQPIVYDLYTGTGTIANFVARKAAKVVGIEYVPEAIEDAKVNAEVNQIDNTSFFAGDMKDILTDDFIAQHGRPDVIITDPPRAGMHPDVVKTILRAAPKRIVYVSCNPATQARDLEMLTTDYRIRKVQPVDMFPHTPHVENVVLLERGKNE